MNTYLAKNHTLWLQMYQPGLQPWPVADVATATLIDSVGSVKTMQNLVTGYRVHVAADHGSYDSFYQVTNGAWMPHSKFKQLSANGLAALNSNIASGELVLIG